MTKKVDTIKITGGAEYAKVAERLKLFREDTTNGSIITTQIQTDTKDWIFTTTIIADKSDPSSKEATGQSFGKLDKTKAFEKLETISVGRALANMGYLASGDVASFEEMEDFKEYKNEKLQDQWDEFCDKANNSKNIKELTVIYNEYKNNGFGEEFGNLLKELKENFKKNENTQDGGATDTRVNKS